MKDQEISALVDQARAASQVVESRRQAMLRAAFRRQEAILSLKAAGLSIRSIADQLNVSASVVQVQLQTATRRRPITTRREERVSYELHVGVLLKFEEAPHKVRAVALQNLAKMEDSPRAPIAESWLKEWKVLVTGPIEHLREGMLADTERAREMRQLSPFAGAISQDERLDAIRKAAV